MGVCELDFVTKTWQRERREKDTLLQRVHGVVARRFGACNVTIIRDIIQVYTDVLECYGHVHPCRISPMILRGSYLSCRLRGRLNLNYYLPLQPFPYAHNMPTGEVSPAVHTAVLQTGILTRGLLPPTVRVGQPVMPRRATRPVALAVKKEVVEDDEADSRNISPTPLVAAAAAAVPVKDESKSSIRRVSPKAHRGGSVVGAGAGASSSSGPALSSRFFPSPSYAAARGRKRKAAGSGLRQAVAIDNRPKIEGGERGGGFTGDDSLSDTTVLRNAATPAADSTTTAASSQRRSSRCSVVKKEELGEGLDLPERFPPAAGATARRGRGSGQRNPSTNIDRKSPRRRAVGGAMDDVCLQQTEKKQKGKEKKAPRKVKVKTKGGKVELEEKPIPSRLAEKAALIIQVMDKLYPEPPIPINHVVRTRPSFSVFSFPFLVCANQHTAGHPQLSKSVYQVFLLYHFFVFFLSF